MPAGDVTALVAGDAVAVEPVNTNFSTLQATLQAQPVANLAHNRAAFKITGTFDSTLASGSAGTIIYCRNVDGLEGWRLVSLQVHALAGGPIAAPNTVTAVATKSSAATFAAPTTMVTTTITNADTAEAGNNYYAQNAPAVADQTVPDSWFFRVILTNASGQNLTFVQVTAHFDMILKVKA